MRMLFEKSQAVEHFDYAKYAIDARFQEKNRPSSRKSTGAKDYFSAKYKLYGLKTEVSVIPNSFSVL